MNILKLLLALNLDSTCTLIKVKYENNDVEIPVKQDFSTPTDFIHSDIISTHDLQSENDNSNEICSNSNMELSFESERVSTSSIVASDVMPSELNSNIGTAVLILLANITEKSSQLMIGYKSSN